MVKLPFLRSPFFVDGEVLRFQHTEKHLTGTEVRILDRIFEGGADLDELAGLLVESGEARDLSSGRSRLESAFQETQNIVGIAEVDIEPEYDVIVLDQGYAGVYVHTVELLKQLQRRWSCLLISPERPLFDEETPIPQVTLAELKEQDPELSYFSFMHLVRSVVKRTRSRLLLCTHRSQSLFVFDVIGERPTIIYCDGYYDGLFHLVRDMRLQHSRKRSRRILTELFYLLGNSPVDFTGFSATPAMNLHMLMAGYYSLRDASENWCWGKEQTTQFLRAFPQLKQRVRFMPPFMDSDLFQQDRVDRERTVLFTTTMHNIDLKGFPELIEAMLALDSIYVRCVVRQPDKLPGYPERLESRLELGAVSKPEMVELYHHVWLNCRTSREESSPMSILESMICEVPQVTSPIVAEQIPILEDGKTGFIVDPDDKPGLVKALARLLESRELRDEMGREARRRALSYSLDARIEAFESYLP